MTQHPLQPSLSYAANPAVGASPQVAWVNPFVPISPVVRRVIIGTVVAFGVFTTAGVFVNTGADDGNPLLIIASNWFYLFWLAFPFIFYRPHYGYAHPLIVLAGLALLRCYVESTGMFMNGLEYHSALTLQTASGARLDRLYAYGNFIEGFAFMCLYAGFAWGPNFPLPRLANGDRPNPFLYVILLSVFGIAALAFTYLVGLSGGIFQHMKNIAVGQGARRMVEDIEGVGQIVIFIQAAIAVALIWLAYQRRALLNPVFWFVGVAAVAMEFLQSGRRSGVVITVMTLGLAWILRHQKMPLKRVLVVGLLLFTFIGTVGLYRRAQWKSDSGVNLEFLQGLSFKDLLETSQAEVTGYASAASGYYAVLAEVPQNHGFLYGTGYVRWAGLFIPRIIWPDKPMGVGKRSGRIFFGTQAGHPPGPVGEAYWNFHLPGVAIVFFLYGAFNRWCARLILNYPASTAAIVIYVVTMFTFTPSESSFRKFAFTIVPALVLLILTGLLRRPAPVRA